MAVSCTKNLSIHVAGATAPCSIFEADSTSMGQRTLNPVINAQVNWNGLDIGSYSFVYEDGAFENWDGLFVCQPDQWGVDSTPPNWSTTGGSSGALPTQASLFTDEPSAIADYHTKTMPSFTNLSSTNSTIDAEIDLNGINVFCASGPAMTFNLLRTQKLVAPQPVSMSVHNLATYATSRFVATYGTDTSALAFNAASATVETALNLLPNIISDGGVTCAGSLATGMAVTWNVNGARSALSGRITTISPGWEVTAIQTQVGNGGQPSIQTLFVTPICDEFIQNLILPDYNGSIPNRSLSGVGSPQWFFTATTNPSAPTNQICGIEYQNTRVSLQCGPDAPSSAPTLVNGGAGNVPAGSHEWLVTFTSNLVQFSNTDSGPGPSAALVLGGNSQVNLSNIPLGPAGTTARNIYRTRAGETAFRLVGTISDNTTTVFTDNVDDASIFFPPNPASRWWALNISCVFNNPPAVELDIWEGYKLLGLDPTGTYSVRPNYFDGSGTCRQVGSGVQSITLDGVF